MLLQNEKIFLLVDKILSSKNILCFTIPCSSQILPAISTIVIALGIQRMIGDNIIVKNIKANGEYDKILEKYGL